jgi:tRNA-Thr(GGU) m(6)t(6)A37 methyltransferase TsaA
MDACLKQSRYLVKNPQPVILKASRRSCSQQTANCKKDQATLEEDKTIRPNERRVDAEPSKDASLRFIGRIRTPWKEREDCPRQAKDDGPECQLIVDPVWQDALDGLEEYNRIEVLYWLNQSRRDLITQSPRGDGKTFGTFALRSPVRPNPIGTSLVKLIRIDGCNLTVRSLDCLNGTPLLDIKPERCSFSPKARPKNGV